MIKLAYSPTLYYRHLFADVWVVNEEWCWNHSLFLCFTMICCLLVSLSCLVPFCLMMCSCCCCLCVFLLPKINRCDRQLKLHRYANIAFEDSHILDLPASDIQMKSAFPLIYVLSLSFPRVINFKFPLQPHQVILHHTAWRISLFIAYSDERWLCCQLSFTSLIHLLLERLGEFYFLNLGVKGWNVKIISVPSWLVHHYTMKLVEFAGAAGRMMLLSFLIRFSTF